MTSLPCFLLRRIARDISCPRVPSRKSDWSAIGWRVVVGGGEDKIRNARAAASSVVAAGGVVGERGEMGRDWQELGLGLGGWVVMNVNLSPKSHRLVEVRS
jgi:hypothetical protein